MIWYLYRFSNNILSIITISLIISNMIVLLEERMPDRKVSLLCEALTKWLERESFRNCMSSQELK